MTIDDVLIFDTESTGVPDRNAKWEDDYESFPHIVQMAWMFRGRIENHIILPEGWEIPEETTEIHGITTEYAKEHGEPFSAVATLFIKDCQEAGLICGHNIYFDTSLFKANVLRDFGMAFYDGLDVENALHKSKRIDTMRPTMKWVDARMANGRLKYPNLSELYSRCFPGESFPAHNAIEDVKAVARCLPVILEFGLVELKVKEYPEHATEQEQKTENAGIITQKVAREIAPATEKPVNGPNSDDNQKDDKLPIQPAKAPEIENLGKITGAAAELLDANEF